MHEKDEYLSSVQYIRERLDEEFGVQLKPWRLMHILQHHMRMKYSRVKEISCKANSTKNLILR